MADIVERLRSGTPGTESTYPTIMNEAADTIATLRAELELLRAENSSLSTWQCEFTDGKTGLVYSEGGGTFCAMARDNERLRAENIQMKFALGYPMPADLERYILPTNPFRCGTCDARAALEETK